MLYKMFLRYLMALFQLPMLQDIQSDWKMFINAKLIRIWKEIVTTYFKALSQKLTGVIEEIHIIPQ